MVTKECRYCGKEFTPAICNQNYCRQCMDTYSRDVLRGRTRNSDLVQACKYCNKEFYGTKKKYCTEECCYQSRLEIQKQKRKNKEIIIYNKICVGCGKEFTTTEKLKTKCKRGCGNKNQNKRILKYKYICKQCGIEYHPKDKKRDSFCSRECFFTYTNKKKEERTVKTKEANKVKEKEYYKCPECGKVKQISSEKILRECLYCNKLKADREYNKNNYKPMQYKCVCCGDSYITSWEYKSKLYCSYECQRKTNKRISRHKRRLRINTEYEVINPISIFERDRWTCQLCGIKTPRNKRGTIKDNAPELDHIVALANGGSHTTKNVQCLCRKCNGEKGTKTQGQLRLF